jgi:membrane protease YdiL (CAAX protease family)
MSSESKGIIVFLLIAFGVAWTIWALWATPIQVWLSSSDLLLRLALEPLGALPAGFAPAIAAIVVRKWVTREGFGDAGLKLNLRDKWHYYLFAWLSPLVVALIIAALAAALGIGRPEFALAQARTLMTPGPSQVFLSSSAYVPIVLVELAVVSLLSAPILRGEEFGWRGYLQVRLLSEHPLLAAVATGLIWGAWHCPFFFLQAFNRASRTSVLVLVVFALGTILLSILFGWLRQRTGSVWGPSLAHAATNSIGSTLLMLWFAGNEHWILWSYMGVLGLVPLGALCAWIILTGRLEPAQGNPIESDTSSEGAIE